MAHRPAIEASGLEKSYGSVKVLRGVDLSVAPGSVFALLGPNGAGKTTTVRILAALTPPDAGRARVAGFDVVADRRRVRRAISLTGQYAAVDEMQTGEENLRMMGRLTRLGRVGSRGRAREPLERFDLTGAARRTVGTYSGAGRSATAPGRPWSGAAESWGWRPGCRACSSAAAPAEPAEPLLLSH